VLQHFLPFWQPQDVQRIAASLCDKGILHLRSAPYLSSGVLDFNLGDDAAFLRCRQTHHRQKSLRLQAALR
jgi:hypothetical protein